MTQEQKQFIIKALESGIPALATEHIAALEEVVHISESKSEDLNGQENWNTLDQRIHANIINTLRSAYPYMADEYIGAYFDAVNVCQSKFAENLKAREEKEAAEKEAEKTVEAKKKKSE